MSGDQDDFDSKNELTVPLKVVREAALNLLIHRTWWSEARVPSVNIFDDRVEFMNPGAFPHDYAVCEWGWRIKWRNKRRIEWRIK